MVHVSNTMWRIKNEPSNSTSCSHNALHLLVLVAGILYWGLQLTSSFSIWGCVLKSYLIEVLYFEGPNHLWRALKTSILNTGGSHPRSARCRLECLVVNILKLRTIHFSTKPLIKWCTMLDKFPAPRRIDLQPGGDLRIFFAKFWYFLQFK